MDNIVKHAEAFSYSDTDIRNLLDGDVAIHKYPDLADKKSIKDILIGQDAKPKSCACILYMTKQNFGHWTALIKHPGAKEGCYEIFDPYGMVPDSELKFIDKDFKEKSNQDRQHLSYIISADLENPNSGVKEVLYNKYKLQSTVGATNTCGRWCAMRCLLKRLSIEEFVPLFVGQKLPPDAYVTLMTMVNK
jgi:hypothetical protein